jgi:hypothetical protein
MYGVETHICVSTRPSQSLWNVHYSRNFSLGKSLILTINQLTFKIMSRKFSLYRLATVIIWIVMGTGVLIAQKATVIDLTKHWGKEENFLLSGVATSIRYVPLETRKECYISNAYQCNIRVTKNYFFIVPRSEPIMIFDRSGKFIRKVGSIGEGPTEVTGFFSYVINETDQWIAVFKPSNSSVLFYSFNGKMIREFPVDKSAFKLTSDPVGNLIVLAMDTQKEILGNTRLIYMNPAGQELKRVELYKTYNLNKRLSMRNYLSIKWETDGSFQVVEAPFTQIYKWYQNGSWEMTTTIQTGEVGEIQSIKPFGDYYLIMGSNPYVNYFVASSENAEVSHCSFAIDAPGGPDISGLYNDLDGGMPILPGYVFSSHEFVTLLDASSLIDYSKGNVTTFGGKAPEIKQSFKDMAAKLTLEDNPVVAVVRMK